MEGGRVKAQRSEAPKRASKAGLPRLRNEGLAKLYLEDNRDLGANAGRRHHFCALCSAQARTLTRVSVYCVLMIGLCNYALVVSWFSGVQHLASNNADSSFFLENKSNARLILHRENRTRVKLSPEDFEIARAPFARRSYHRAINRKHDILEDAEELVVLE